MHRVEIHKDHSDENSKGYLSRDCYSKGVRSPICWFQKQAEEGKLDRSKKGSPGCAPIRGCEHGDPIGGLWVHAGFLLWVLNWNQGQKLGKLSIINRVLVDLSQWLQELLLGFLE